VSGAAARPFEGIAHPVGRSWRRSPGGDDVAQWDSVVGLDPVDGLAHLSQVGRRSCRRKNA